MAGVASKPLSINPLPTSNGTTPLVCWRSTVRALFPEAAPPVGWPTKCGAAWAIRPIIGAGLFVDNEIGGACATGLGELVMRTCGSFLVVELMRQGRSPQQACEEAALRIVKKQDFKDIQGWFPGRKQAGRIWRIQHSAGVQLYRIAGQKDAGDRRKIIFEINKFFSFGL